MPKRFCLSALFGLVPFLVLAHTAVLFEDPAQKDAFIQDLSHAIPSLLEQWHIPGLAVAVVYDGQVLFEQGFGVKKTGGSNPVTPSTLFQIGSTSKAFTSFLLARLEDQGLLGWHQRVQQIVPAFTLKDTCAGAAFQVQDLPAQHSGMYPYDGDYLAFLGYGPEKILQSTSELETQSSFRTTFSYVNTLFVVAGYVAENVTGMPLKELYAQEVFTPLQLSHTYAGPEQIPDLEQLAYPHWLQAEVLQIDDPFAPTGRWIATYLPAGGLYSNVQDLSRWLGFWLQSGEPESNQALSEQNRKKLLTPQTHIMGGANDPLYFYCLGWLLEQLDGEALFWHNGETVGSHAFVGFSPSSGLGVAILSNRGGQDFPDRLGMGILKAVLGLAPSHFWEKLSPLGPEEAEDQPTPTHYLPPLELEAYTGLFYHPLFGQMCIRQADDRLVATMGPLSFALPMRHTNRDSFSLVFHPFFEDFATATFLVDSWGQANAFVLDFNEGSTDFFFERLAEEPPQTPIE